MIHTRNQNSRLVHPIARYRCMHDAVQLADVCTKIINNHSEYLSELNRVGPKSGPFLVLDGSDTTNSIEIVCLEGIKGRMRARRKQTVRKTRDIRKAHAE